MNDKTRQLIAKEAIDMWESLRLSVEEAGGGFDKDYYMNMSVGDLISLLCTNSVRFTYKPNMQADYDYYKNTIEIQNSTIKELKAKVESKEKFIISLKESLKGLSELYENKYDENKNNKETIENQLETIKNLRYHLDNLTKGYNKLIEENKKLLIQQSYSVNQHNNFLETIKELQARLDLTNEDYEKLAKAYHECQANLR